MRLDESGADSKVCLDNVTVYLHRCAPRGRADIDCLVHIVIYNLVVGHNVTAKLFNKLLLVEGRMQSEGNYNGYIFPLHFLFQFSEERRQQPVIRTVGCQVIRLVGGKRPLELKIFASPSQNCVRPRPSRYCHRVKLNCIMARGWHSCSCLENGC